MPDRRLILLAAGLAAAAGDGPAILRPSDRAALPAGPLLIVARGPGRITLDGRPVAAEPLGGGAFSAAVTPGAGPHELAIGGRRVRFFVGPGAPEDFRPYRVHPPGAVSCGACHAVREGQWEFRGAFESCFGCHEGKKFPATHAHDAVVLGECGLCHDPHGSAEKFHLKLSREAACRQCHG